MYVIGIQPPVQSRKAQCHFANGGSEGDENLFQTILARQVIMQMVT